MMAKKIIKFPIPLNPPALVEKPKITKTTPIIPIILLKRIKVFLDISFSSNFMNSLVITELITKATNKDENKTTDKVIGK